MNLSYLNGSVVFAVELQFKMLHSSGKEKNCLTKENMIHNFADCNVFGLFFLFNRLENTLLKHFQTAATTKGQRNHLTL